MTPHRTTAAPASASTVRALVPGIMLCLAAAGLSLGLAALLPGLPALLCAIVMGMAAANLELLPSAGAAGIAFSSRHLLRAGIVVLGLQLVLGDILALGAPLLGVVLAVVVGGIIGTLTLGRLLGVPGHLSLLVACGFSICGAAAVAGAAGASDPHGEREQDAVTAIALVALFGTLMIGIVPLLSSALGLEAETTGLWAGASIHEIAQVVAVGGFVGGGALSAAVVVKLARVLLLAPVIAILSLHRRRTRKAADPDASPGALPPVVPLFVVGFLAMVLVRSLLPIPDPALAGAQLLQTLLLAAAMFGLGCGVRFRALAAVGARPFALAALSTLLVAGIAAGGIALATP
ncbi:putative sulfate exporter family transporter [Kocuria sp. p3-SID1428]|uniref:YeiH family protein n=2 Tax=unclassified Kocuria TaxID=2649579 RepID=UPI0021A26AC6|nr:putative sulfate exporter family transporter [Kocuria sp. p3-SID1428]MCT1601335.1 putative sulfate exporter family transporter [Kocuria sp. p3-SID1428]